jgi:hypothetical protein
MSKRSRSVEFTPPEVPAAANLQSATSTAIEGADFFTQLSLPRSPWSESYKLNYVNLTKRFS